MLYYGSILKKKLAYRPRAFVGVGGTVLVDAALTDRLLGACVIDTDANRATRHTRTLGVQAAVADGLLLTEAFDTDTIRTAGFAGAILIETAFTYAYKCALVAFANSLKTRILRETVLVRTTFSDELIHTDIPNTSI